MYQYFSGLMCYLCSPLAKNYFQFINGSFVMRVDPTTCHKMFFWYRYSLNMIKFFNNTLYPLIEFIKCNRNKLEDPHYALFLIDDPSLESSSVEISVCSDDFIVSDPHCYKKCSTNFHNIGLKYNFIRNYKQALKSKKSSMINS
jgi:hypothetical protein